jgi:hypothetical protein
MAHAGESQRAALALGGRQTQKKSPCRRMLVGQYRKLFGRASQVGHQIDLVQRLLATARLLPATVDHLVTRDAKEPAPERVVGVLETGQTAKRIGKGLLGDIGRILPIPQTVKGIAQDIVPISLVQRRKRARVLLGPANQGGIAFQQERSFDVGYRLPMRQHVGSPLPAIIDRV